MVKLLSTEEAKILTNAIADAQKRTNAELAIAIAAVSDGYEGFVFICSLLSGSVLALSLWWTTKIQNIPALFALQLLVVTLFISVPWLRHLCMLAVPKQLRHYRAALRGEHEFLTLSHRLTPQTPLVLLYVSLKERYAHILTSAAVEEKIPASEWNAVMRGFTGRMAKDGLKEACLHALQHEKQLLQQHFPGNENAHRLAQPLIEMKS